MSKEVFRRCGCRDENEKQFGTKCPLLATDGKHGTWAYAASAGAHRSTGKRLQLRKAGYATKKDAQRALTAARSQADTGRVGIAPSFTVSAFLTRWLEDLEQDGLRPATIVMYRAYAQNDIIPALGRMRLADLRRYDVDEFVRGLSSETRGATTVRRIHAALSAALGRAVQLSLIDSNPATGVKLPKVEKFRPAMWEPDQASAFLAASASERLGPLFEMAVHTGLRRGELCGLRWEDVSFTDRELVVRFQLMSVSGKTYEGRVKTNSGQDRVVALDDALLDVLSQWKLKQDEERDTWGDAYEDSGRVFTYENGEQLRPEYASQVFRRVVERGGFSKLRFHDLRHLHASLLISAGVSLAVISKRLGHSTIAITIDLYGHLLRDANRDAAEASAAMLRPREPDAHTVPSQP